VITAAILGASGYSGAELMRLLTARNDVTVKTMVAATSAGQRVDALYPALAGRVNGSFETFSPDLVKKTDVAFIALPSGEAMNIVPQLRENVSRIIDLGGDFRLRSAEDYERYYKKKHTAAALLSTAVYGLPEVNKDLVRDAQLVANPGCYPTSAILGLLPALGQGLVQPAGIVINSLSGVSGAGRSSSFDMSFAEINENVRAYKIGNHQHIPEIESVLGQHAGTSVIVSFVPHLLPITRGIYTTIHATLTHAVTDAEVLNLYDAFYAEAPFVRVKRQVPQIKNVAYTNYCDIGLSVDVRTNQLIIVSVIDNLVKGAAGQAIQNMNIMFGLPEKEGLV